MRESGSHVKKTLVYDMTSPHGRNSSRGLSPGQFKLIGRASYFNPAQDSDSIAGPLKRQNWAFH
jgi:hypothetical protein